SSRKRLHTARARACESRGPRLLCIKASFRLSLFLFISGPVLHPHRRHLLACTVHLHLSHSGTSLQSTILLLLASSLQSTTIHPRLGHPSLQSNLTFFKSAAFLSIISQDEASRTSPSCVPRRLGAGGALGSWL